MKILKPSGNRIILIRHGETEWNRLRRFQGRSDISLNPKGNEQACSLALAFKNETIMAIHSSPLARAIETASHIGKFHPSALLIKETGLIEPPLFLDHELYFHSRMGQKVLWLTRRTVCERGWDWRPPINGLARLEMVKVD